MVDPVGHLNLNVPKNYTQFETLTCITIYNQIIIMWIKITNPAGLIKPYLFQNSLSIQDKYVKNLIFSIVLCLFTKYPGVCIMYFHLPGV